MFAGVQGLFTEEVIRCFAYVFIELYREGWLGAVCGRRSHRQPVTADTDRIGDLSKSRCAQHVPTVAATQEYGSLGVADASRETSRVITRYRGCGRNHGICCTLEACSRLGSRTEISWIRGADARALVARSTRLCVHSPPRLSVCLAVQSLSTGCILRRSRISV